MQSTMMAPFRQRGCTPGIFNSMAGGAVIGSAGFAKAVSPAPAFVRADSSLQQPGYRWYYTDPSRTQGFWDVRP
jgi:hypothetical protein